MCILACQFNFNIIFSISIIIFLYILSIQVAPQIKEKMMKQGTLMVAYQPLPSKGLVNFFRMVFHCVPEPTEEDVTFVLDEIEKLGKDL